MDSPLGALKASLNFSRTAQKDKKSPQGLRKKAKSLLINLTQVPAAYPAIEIFILELS
jgi:hypothetical protein